MNAFSQQISFEFKPYLSLQPKALWTLWKLAGWGLTATISTRIPLGNQLALGSHSVFMQDLNIILTNTFCKLDKYILQFGQINLAMLTNAFGKHFDKYILQFCKKKKHLAILTNKFCNFDKWILLFWHFEIWAAAPTRTCPGNQSILDLPKASVFLQNGTAVYTICQFGQKYWTIWSNMYIPQLGQLSLPELRESNRRL